MRKLAIISALMAACGSVESAVSSGDAGSETPTDAGLVPEGVTSIVVTAKGGGPLPPSPDGSTCRPTKATYSIALPARELSFDVCDWGGGDGGPYLLRTGQKTLSAAEYASVDTAVRALTRATKTVCGFDKQQEDITFTSPSGTVVYYDDFYFCDAGDSKIYVRGIDQIIQAIDQYAR